MPKGGRRKGAGRKPGSANIKSRKIADKAAEEGITPLEYMVTIMRNPYVSLSERMEAAKAAAPYMHPRLTVSDVRQTVSVKASHEEWLERLRAQNE